MGQKIKWAVFQVKAPNCDLMPNDVLYTKRIIPFIRKVTREEILDDLQTAGLLTEEVRKVIEG